MPTLVCLCAWLVGWLVGFRKATYFLGPYFLSPPLHSSVPSCLRPSVPSSRRSFLRSLRPIIPSFFRRSYVIRLPPLRSLIPPFLRSCGPSVLPDFVPSYPPSWFLPPTTNRLVRHAENGLILLIGRKEHDLALKVNHIVKRNDHVHQGRLKQAQNGEVQRGGVAPVARVRSCHRPVGRGGGRWLIGTVCSTPEPVVDSWCTILLATIHGCFFWALGVACPATHCIRDKEPCLENISPLTFV